MTHEPRHKHQDLIDEYEKGAYIQVFLCSDKGWGNVDNPEWHWHETRRVNPYREYKGVDSDCQNYNNIANNIVYSSIKAELDKIEQKGVALADEVNELKKRLERAEEDLKTSRKVHELVYEKLSKLNS